MPCRWTAAPDKGRAAARRRGCGRRAVGPLVQHAVRVAGSCARDVCLCWRESTLGAAQPLAARAGWRGGRLSSLRRAGGDGGARCTTSSSSLGSLAGPSLLDKQNEGPATVENKRRSTRNRGRGETSSAGRGSSPPRRLASRPASHKGAWALAALHPGRLCPAPPSPGSSLELPSSHLARLLPRAGRVGSPPARRPAFPAAPSSSSQRG